ncbi:hypothetical protein K491DRAFT_149352 [Lophiostoma macrostomum CBS 122681]|uniref:Uncharacterized protein n=1 Tax=Lophiostoma macrostomum CBS 122681 TaxID=1314788 RepID=A0A6A6SR59_9PLEO|nr:hypothetical protein K491DRAFT_149352 [Lophiostoma macrostomum CBS 122681]
MVSSSAGTTYLHTVSLAMLLHFCHKDAIKELLCARSIVEDGDGCGRSDLRADLVIPLPHRGMGQSGDGGAEVDSDTDLDLDSDAHRGPNTRSGRKDIRRRNRQGDIERCRDALQKVIGYMWAWCYSGGEGFLNRDVRREFSECLEDSEYGRDVDVEEMREVGRICGLLGLVEDRSKIAERIAMRAE